MGRQSFVGDRRLPSPLRHCERAATEEYLFVGSGHATRNQTHQAALQRSEITDELNLTALE